MSLFGELKRRNVFRVGFAYSVASWLIIQVADTLISMLGLPDWAPKLVLLLLLVGFVPAIIFAWAFELTPEGIKRESEIDRDHSITTQTGRKLNHATVVLLALAVVYLLIDKFSGSPPETPPVPIAETVRFGDQVAQPAEETPPAVPRQSIAVLPFENRSPIAGDEFFIDGIHDDLLTTLARIGGLKVISRTSVSRYEGSDKSIPEIARELGVATIMEGAVQRAGNTVRINVQLIDAQTDEHLWAEFFDRELNTDNLFAIQTEITERIAGALEAELTPDEERRLQEQPTENLEAYSAYLRGLRAFEQREVETMRRALAEFRRAVELDPDFALGWAGIAQVADVMPSWGGMTREEGRAIALPAAQRALELAPDLGEAHLAMAMTMDGDEALAQYRKAIELLPNHAQAHAWYANALQGPPGPEWLEALALLRKAESLDPLSAHYRSQVVRQLTFMGRFEEAQRKLQVLLQTDPDFAPAYGFMSWVSGGLGNLDGSIIWAQRYLQKDTQVQFPKRGMVDTLWELGDRQRLVHLAETWRQANPEDPYALYADIAVAFMDGRYDAVPELASGLTRAPGGLDDNGLFETAFAHTYRRDYRAALAAWQQAVPEFFDPESLPEAAREFAGLSCAVADVARRAGEPELADALARASFDYIKNEAPKYVVNAETWLNVAYCNAYFGDYEAALEGLEARLQQRNFRGWQEPGYLEMFDPLRGDPRFQSLMQAFEDEMTRQRTNLDWLEAQAAKS